MRTFPIEIQNFGTAFRIMQTKRHSADYDPIDRFAKSLVVEDIVAAEQAIEGFLSAPVKDRRAFCAHVLFKKR